MNGKQSANRKSIVISSFADIKKLNPNISSVHFRKFASKKLLDIALKKCSNLKALSFSGYAFKRLSLESKEKIKQRKISLKIFNLRGRPNSLKFYSCPGSSEMVEQLSCNMSNPKNSKMQKSLKVAKIREQQAGSSKHLFIGSAGAPPLRRRRASMKKAAPKSKNLSQGSKKIKGVEKK